MSRGLYLAHPACLLHDPRQLSPGHPDTPERLVALEAELERLHWLAYERRLAPAADVEQLELAHSAAHVEMVRRLSLAGGGAIDPDTFVVAASYEAALRAAGAACEMTRALLARETPVGFCGVRPSGHHAERGRAMGFCLFNNVAVAAAFALAELGLARVLVLDWDVHHGNGTAEIFERRKDVLFVSLHQSPLYPGTGALHECGSAEGEGYTINLPVPPGSAEPLWLALLDRVVLPAARAFEPELVLVSAGFDAHHADPLAACRLETTSFVEMACRVRDLATALGVPLGLVMEGGYNKQVLAECIAAVLPAIAGDGEATVSDQDLGAHTPILEAAQAQVSRHWPTP